MPCRPVKRCPPARPSSAAASWHTREAHGREQLEVRAQFDAVEERFRALCASPACSAVALVLVPLAQVADAAVDSGAKLLGRLCGRREIEFHQLEQDDDDY